MACAIVDRRKFWKLSRAGGSTIMQFKRLAIVPAAIAAVGIASGCFSYHKKVEETAPAPAVVETVPAPAPATSTSTTTTTTTDNGVVEKQKTTTYTNPGY
jgi:hypothetical protein